MVNFEQTKEVEVGGGFPYNQGKCLGQTITDQNKIKRYFQSGKLSVNSVNSYSSEKKNHAEMFHSDIF